MRRIILQRTESDDQGTFGMIDVEGQTFHTGELPWRDNEPEKSCIPAGTYLVEMDPSPRFKRDLYELRKVPGRSTILIHSGNFCGDVEQGYVSHVEGCILLGLTRGVLRNKFGKEQEAVCASKPALAEFEALMGGAPFELEIRDVEENADGR